MVTFCDGHTASQKPHSMHLVTLSSTSGDGLEVAQVHARVAVEDHAGSEDPGRVGEPLDLATSSRSPPAPHSRSTNGAMLSPVPCSAFSEPSYLSTISSTMLVR